MSLQLLHELSKTLTLLHDVHHNSITTFNIIIIILIHTLTGKVDALLRCLTKFRYLTDKLTVVDLMIRADTDLFKKMQMPQHCLHHLLPPLRMTDSLRQRGHPFSLPECYTNIQRKSFVMRSLYDFI